MKLKELRTEQPHKLRGSIRCVIQRKSHRTQQQVTIPTN